MSVKCANINDPEYKRLEKIISNKVVLGMVWDHLDGNVSKIKTLDDFMKVAKEAKNSIKLDKKAVAKQQEAIE